MPPVHDSAVARVRFRARQRSTTISETERSSSPKRYGSSASRREAASAAPRSAADGLREDVDVDLELARADRHVHSVALAAGGRECLRHGGLRRAEEPQHAMLSRRRALEDPSHRLGLERAGPQALELARRTGQDDDDAPFRVEDDSRRGSGESERDARLRAASPACARRSRTPCTSARGASRSPARSPRSGARAPRPGRAAGLRRAPRARRCDRRASGRARPRRGRDPPRSLGRTRSRDPRRDLRRSRSAPGRGRAGRLRRRGTARCGPGGRRGRARSP